LVNFLARSNHLGHSALHNAKIGSREMTDSPTDQKTYRSPDLQNNIW
jgi:hypothetical protein